MRIINLFLGNVKCKKVILRLFFKQLNCIQVKLLFLFAYF
nr:MAG TPA: hypothetical protein [Caudoviricetes sp.]